MQAKSDRNNGPFHWLEKRLWRSGVQDPTIREILCWQISVIALSLLFGAVLWPFHPAGAWIFWFGKEAAFAPTSRDYFRNKFY